MKSDDMKMKKFEMLIRDIDEYLGGTGIYGKRKVSRMTEEGDEITEYVPISPLEFLIDNDGKSEYLNLIYKNSFSKRYGRNCIDLAEIEKQDITTFIARIRKCNGCFYDASRRTSVPNHLLFWLIFIVSVDNDNYNENLSIVSDTAYLLGFDEKKLQDWIVAVKGVLEGKKLKELKYQTEEAKTFFIR
mgnify:CR=1 FL=1